MFTITWITAARSIESISTPSASTAYAVFASLEMLRYHPRLWKHASKQQRLIF
jgi:hypothetical protein